MNTGRKVTASMIQAGAAEYTAKGSSYEELVKVIGKFPLKKQGFPYRYNDIGYNIAEI